MLRNVKFYILPIIIVLSFFSNHSHATIILQTASGEIDPNAPSSISSIVNDIFFPTHRFEITQTTELSSVGGFFSVFGGDATIFAAFTSLASPTDLPNSIDLSTDDVITSTTFSVREGQGFILNDFTLTLEPGFYALTFGSGLFGADNIIFSPDLSVGLRHLPNDLSADVPITIVQPSALFNLTGGFFSGGTGTPAFILSTENASNTLNLLNAATHIPEPKALTIWLLAVLLITRIKGNYFILRNKGSKSQPTQSINATEF